jgi:hypothetical protein
MGPRFVWVNNGKLNRGSHTSGVSALLRYFAVVSLTVNVDVNVDVLMLMSLLMAVSMISRYVTPSCRDD